MSDIHLRDYPAPRVALELGTPVVAIGGRVLWVGGDLGAGLCHDRRGHTGSKCRKRGSLGRTTAGAIHSVLTSKLMRGDIFNLVYFSSSTVAF